MGPKAIVKLGRAVLSLVNIIFDLDISGKCLTKNSLAKKKKKNS